MFLKKKESKGWHPAVVLTLGTLAVVGAVVVTNNAKRIIMKMKEKVGCMMKSMPDDRTDS